MIYQNKIPYPYSKNVCNTQKFHQDSHQIKNKDPEFILQEQVARLLATKN